MLKNLTTIEITVGVTLTILLLWILILVVLIITQRRRTDKKNNRIIRARDYILDKYYKGIYKGEIDISKKFLIDEYLKIEDQVEFSRKVRRRALNDFSQPATIRNYVLGLNSPFKTKRILSAYYLGAFDYKDVCDDLIKRLKKEKNEVVKFYISYSLIKYVYKEAFLEIVNSTIGSSIEYQRKIGVIVTNNFNKNSAYLFNLEEREEMEVMTLILRIAKRHINPFLQKYTIFFFNEYKNEIFKVNHQDNQKTELYIAALNAVINVDYTLINNYKLIQSKNERLRIMASEIVNKSRDYSVVLELLDSITDENFNLISDTVLKIMINESSLFLRLFNEYKKVMEQQKKDLIAIVLSSRIEYIIYKINGEEELVITELLYHLISLGRTAAIIDFLNNNSNKNIESRVLKIISNVVSSNTNFEKEIRTYLKVEVLKKLNKSKLNIEPVEKEPKKFELGKFIWLLAVLLLSFSTYPLFFLLKNNFSLDFDTGWSLVYQFIIDVNYNLVFYFLAVNTIYIIQLILSFVVSSKQVKLWDIKRYKMLFEENLLPSVSIIAPAYNEEKSVIESVKSLLNIKYPDYNVIVVNDGSVDSTLKQLIEYFDLERKNPFFTNRIDTKEVRSVYYNKYIPNLIVVDKENGGKADALNVGINFSDKKYICGIDADSLLEFDSLLRAISVSLDFNEHLVAIGGNISPINGCEIDHGKIETYGLGEKLIEKYQTIEYMRAFNTGRLGWSSMKSLLLVSGAFGVFDKEKIVEDGGYISSSGFHKKDTVGEDMELVVRLSRSSLEKKYDYRVEYVYHAVCYTELPSDSKTLFKQRNRWHRGLLDILHYHRKMIFNYKYKQPGMLGMPYYVIFEMIGPFLELIGYTMLISGLILGILNPLLVLAVFMVTVLFGVVLSLSALLVAEKKDEYTNSKTTLLLIFFAIIDNFGYRQYVSIHRVFSFFTALKDNGEWGKQKRKGFK